MPRKVLATGGTSLSALSDNGTNVTSTEALIVPASTGTITANSVQLSGSATTGLYMALNSATAISNTTSGWISVANTAASGAQIPVASGYGISSSASVNSAASDTIWTRGAAANWVAGKAANASPVANTLTIGESSRGGTDTNVAGAVGTIQPGIGTGTGLASKLAVNRNLVGTTGTTAQAQANAWAVGQSKTLSNTSATAQTIATITLGSNAGGGCAGTFTIVSTDGTNFDAETQSFNVSFVNKATVVTVGAVVVTATTAAANSGTTSLGITAVANGNNIDIKVTPVFGTIVPTTVTLYPVITHSTNTVTFI